MTEMLDILGSVQSGGGLLIIGIVAVARLWRLETDFYSHRHEEDEIIIERGK